MIPPPGGSSDGDLPFTGFRIEPLALLAAVLLLAGGMLARRMRAGA